jgi:hypothetical protein
MPESEVNIRKMIQTQRDAYQVPDGEEWRITVSELIANSLDSKATLIKIGLNKGDKPGFFTITCEDNGRGMDKENFKKYHDIYTITKSRRSGTIGFAGIGAKLTLDLCERVETETKSEQDNYYHSDWYFVDGTNVSLGPTCTTCGEPINSEKPHYHILNDVYKSNDVRQEMGEHTGTFVKVVNLRTKNLNENSLRRYVMAEYQYSIILKNVKIFLNGKELKPLVPEGDEIEKENKYQASYKTKEGFGSKLELLWHFYYVDHKYKERVENENPEEINHGFDIVVYGKRITRDTFGIERMMKAAESLYVYGYVECDQLIDIVEPSKDAFNLKSGRWRFFEAKVTKHIKSWLHDIGKLDEDFWKYEEKSKSKEINKLLNVLQANFPHLIDDFFGEGKSRARVGGDSEDQSKGMGETIILSDTKGDILGSVTAQGTLTEGIHGGGGISEGPSVPSNVQGSDTGVTTNESGNTRLSEKRYRQRKPRLNYYIHASEAHEAVSWDPTRYAFVINESHPGYKYSRRTGPKGTDLYIINTIIDFLIREKDDLNNNEEQRREIIYNLYKTLLSG